MEAAEFIKRGEAVAFPTETVYGLGANLFDEAAIHKIFTAKNRPADNPLIAHVATLDDLTSIAEEINDTVCKLIEAFFPGALTLVLKKTSRVPFIATAGLETIGVRMPRNKIAQKFITACGMPIVAPSANISGRPSPTTWQAVKEDLNGRIACILQGEQTEIGIESTVVDCTTDTPHILRAGSVTLEQLRAIVSTTKPANIKQANEPARSPGMKYRHYAPRASVVIIEDARNIVSTFDGAYIGVTAPDNLSSFKLQRICRETEEYAHELFQFFRECDAVNVSVIFCEAVKEENLGAALMERLKRAAQY
ncbi:MAG: L-threonylcarbamoyladenylate synthase [Pyrinomonadaceae bacterium]